MIVNGFGHMAPQTVHDHGLRRASGRVAGARARQAHPASDAVTRHERFMIVGSFDQTATETAHDHDAEAASGGAVRVARGVRFMIVASSRQIAPESGQDHGSGRNGWTGRGVGKLYAVSVAV